MVGVSMLMSDDRTPIVALLAQATEEDAPKLIIGGGKMPLFRNIDRL
jgi:hypothetical protein